MKRAGLLIIGILVTALVTRFCLSSEQQTRCDVCITLPDLTPLLNPQPRMELPYPAPPTPEAWSKLTATERLSNVRGRVQPLLEAELQKQGLRLGSHAFLRGFKESRELELWLQKETGWQLFRTYPIAAMSGSLGPKLREGDGQTPEGFYAVKSAQLNPASSYHLAMNIGYPNAWDRHHQRTGSFIMIHGREVSIGCLAMTDPVIEEIYLIIEAAVAKGQKEIPVHLFPFRMTDTRLAQAKTEPEYPFWQELQPIYQSFESHHSPPTVRVVKGRYLLQINP